MQSSFAISPEGFALKENVAALIASTGLDRLGFLTLTFPDNCADPKQAYGRFDSFNTNYLSSHPQFGSWLCVKERRRVALSIC